MSFVNLMADDEWSEADIVNRMESMIRERYPASEESIINRKITGAGMGFYVLTDDEKAEVADYAQVCEIAQLAGRAARADMALLVKVKATEAAQARLARATTDSEQDQTERAAAQVTLNAAATDVLALVTQRAEARGSLT